MIAQWSAVSSGQRRQGTQGASLSISFSDADLPGSISLNAGSGASGMATLHRRAGGLFCQCGNEEAAVPADVVRASPKARFEERLRHASLELGAALHLHRPIAEELATPTRPPSFSDQ